MFHEVVKRYFSSSGSVKEIRCPQVLFILVEDILLRTLVAFIDSEDIFSATPVNCLSHRLFIDDSILFTHAKRSSVMEFMKALKPTIFGAAYA